MNSSVPEIANGVLEAVGGTPLVRLSRFIGRDDIELLAKLEAFNPGGSAKDRPARMMLDQAIKRGEIKPGTTIIESSSGNMGIGLAQACRYHELPFICVVDPRAQPQNLDIIRALGGRIEMVRQPLDGDFLAARIARVCELLERLPESYWPNQYSNRDNPKAHIEGTILEIDQSLGGDFDVLLVATSSTGTAQGCRDYLTRRGRNVEVIAVDSVGSVLFGGSAGPRIIPGLGAGREPRLASGQSFDRVHRVTDLQCVVGCRRAAEREAILVGGSAGGVLMTVSRLRHELVGKRCVALLHDSGTRYLSTVFNDDWVESQLQCDSRTLRQLIDEDKHLTQRETAR